MGGGGRGEGSAQGGQGTQEFTGDGGKPADTNTCTGRCEREVGEFMWRGARKSHGEAAGGEVDVRQREVGGRQKMWGAAKRSVGAAKRSGGCGKRYGQHLQNATSHCLRGW